MNLVLYTLPSFCHSFIQTLSFEKDCVIMHHSLATAFWRTSWKGSWPIPEFRSVQFAIQIFQVQIWGEQKHIKIRDSFPLHSLCCSPFFFRAIIDWRVEQAAIFNIDACGGIQTTDHGWQLGAWHCDRWKTLNGLKPSMEEPRWLVSFYCYIRNPIYKWMTGWWFGTFFIFPYIGNNHPNWLIFFRGVQTTNQMISSG